MENSKTMNLRIHSIKISNITPNHAEIIPKILYFVLQALVGTLLVYFSRAYLFKKENLALTSLFL